jgi:large subunit ribosomal protein L3
MVGLLGKKIGMTQFFKPDQTQVAATVIEAGPCAVLQVKDKTRDGYAAVQLGFQPRKEKNISAALKGHLAKAKSSALKFVREIRTTEQDKYELGQKITVEIFSAGDIVDISGTSIGRGFQGGVKRWGWHSGPQTHGSMSHRRVGSIGSSTTPGRVLRGRHLPGHMGNRRVTIQNLEVLEVDKENNLLVVNGSIPGCKNGFLIIRSGLRKQKVKPKVVQVKEKKKAAPGSKKEGAQAKPAQPAKK